jgi:uncharacterized protein (UPF0335 family)
LRLSRKKNQTDFKTMKQANTRGQLKAIIERIECLEEEKASIQCDIKEVYAEAKGVGFDVKVIRALVRERKLSDFERQEYAAVLDLYRASLGMLDGTPLGDAARRRFEANPQSRDEQADVPNKADSGTTDTQPDQPTAPEIKPELTASDLDATRAAGREAALAGKRVIENPYVAGDPRRAAWDEGWCEASNSDGMEIPAAWRRSTPKKPTASDEKGPEPKPEPQDRRPKIPRGVPGVYKVAKSKAKGKGMGRGKKP